MSTCQHGFLGVKANLKKLGDVVVLNFSDTARFSIVYECVTDVEDWVCTPATVVTPGAHEHKGLPVGCLGVTTTSKGTPLLKFAAEAGFKGLSLTFLKKLHELLPLEPRPPETPSTAEAIIDGLIAHVCPEALPGDKKKYLLAREADDADMVWDVAGDAMDDLEMLFEMADEDYGPEEVDEFEKLKTKRRHTHATHGATPGFGSLGTALGLPSALSTGAKKVPAKKPMDFAPGRGLTAAEAKKFAPPGLRLRKEENWHFRWKADADYLKPGRSKTYSSSDHGTDNSALQFVLTVSWAAYCAANKTTCPWELDSALF